MRKPVFCICENKDADQLRGNREADQRLCFRYTDSTISLLLKYKISSLQQFSVAVQPGLYGTWSETPKTGFLGTRPLLFTIAQKYRIKTYETLNQVQPVQLVKRPAEHVGVRFPGDSQANILSL